MSLAELHPALPCSMSADLLHQCYALCCAPATPKQQLEIYADADADADYAD